MSAMKTLLLLTALFTLLDIANARHPCTAEEMEGLQIVGYAYKRVFRFTNYTGYIELHDELDKTLKESDVLGADIGYLVHLHQGFDRKLILLRYGFHGEDKGEYGGSRLQAKWIYNSEIYLAVLDDASVDSREAVQTKRSGFDCDCSPEENKEFASFVYGHRIYYEGGYTDVGQKGSRYFEFVSNASLCTEVKFPVVDIAVDPPTCHNRMLNETADSEAADDEWIVALVDGIRTTRSKTLCGQTDDVRNPYTVVAKNDNVDLPNHDVYCYYLKKPGMKTPCLFAAGNKYVFIDVQVEPANPVRKAKKVPTTNSPITTESAPEAASSQPSTKDEPDTSGRTTSSFVLYGVSVLCLLSIL